MTRCKVVGHSAMAQYIFNMDFVSFTWWQNFTYPPSFKIFHILIYNLNTNFQVFFDSSSSSQINVCQNANS